MKLSSKVVGCVKETSFVRSDGNLLFASGNEIIITGGENGDQLLFQKIPDGNISSMSASVSEPLLAVGSETGIKIFRVIRSQLSCLSISRIMNTTAKERIDFIFSQYWPFKDSSNPSHFIFGINIGNRRIRHRTTF